MAKIINITDKLSLEKPQVVIGDDSYEINDSMSTVLKFQELSVSSTDTNMMSAIELAIGKEAVEKIGLGQMSLSNFKVVTIAIMAAMQNIDFDEAASRFPL